ncbi:hypothetical protein HPB51_020318 [Rhipicephalus microplus]|uniref:Uncharacterized protein n=1 Tax=Rhipicephalus microplus TaxID=6941 RepID=A0A9J6DCA0_RHIMP|nr:hypothetical protein HPB51_020318 [Rhipicephalus microplus]
MWPFPHSFRCATSTRAKQKLPLLFPPDPSAATKLPKAATQQEECLDSVSKVRLRSKHTIRSGEKKHQRPDCLLELSGSPLKRKQITEECARKMRRNNEKCKDRRDTPFFSRSAQRCFEASTAKLEKKKREVRQYMKKKKPYLLRDGPRWCAARPSLGRCCRFARRVGACGRRAKTVKFSFFAQHAKASDARKTHAEQYSPQNHIVARERIDPSQSACSVVASHTRRRRTLHPPRENSRLQRNREKKVPRCRRSDEK